MSPRNRLLLATSAAVFAYAMPSAALAQNTAPQAAATDTGGLADIIVTARRQNENLQTVPVAVSVISDAMIASKGTFRPEDIAQSAPGLSIGGGGDTDRGNVIFSIRGQSFTYGALFPSVITYFAEVPTKYLSVGQFYDSESLQVLRGPQGVQFGRVTNGGNVMMAPKKPTNSYSADITLKGGQYGLIGTTGFANVPVISDTLMVRFAWDIAKRNGFTQNVGTNQDIDDLNYKGGRIGVLWKPTSNIENYLVAQYQETDDNGSGNFLTDVNPAGVKSAVSGLFGFGGLLTAASDLGILAPVYGINPTTGRVGAFGVNGNTTPLTADNYVAAIQAGLTRQQQLGKDKVYFTGPLYNKRKYFYLVNTTTFDVTPNVQVKNIFGYTRYIERSAQNYFGDNSGDVQPCHGACVFSGKPTDVPFHNDQQFSEELRLSGHMLDGRLTWSLGGYMDEQKPGGPVENDTTFGGVLEYMQSQQVTTKSRAVYGYAEYAVTEKLKVNGGVRYTHDTVDSVNGVFNSLLPVPGLQNMLQTNLFLYRDAFGVPAFQGLTDAQLIGLATLTANSGAAVPHGKCADYNGGSFTTKCVRTQGTFNSTTFTIGASYEFGPRQLIYAKFSKGYRPGGVNATFPAGFENLKAFKPENNYSAEIGIKADWSLGAVPVRTNLTAFRDRYKGIQQSVQIRDTNGNPGSIVTNVAAATIWGIEFEGQIRPMAGMTIGANYSYTHARYDHGAQTLADINTPGTETYLACNPTIATNLGFCTFNRFPIVPEHQLGINWQWNFIRDQPKIGTIGIGGNLYYQSHANAGAISLSYFNPDQPGYTTLNLNANWNHFLDSSVDLMVYMTNVTNRRYDMTYNSNLEASGIGNRSHVYAAPRMWGVSATAHF